MPPQSTEEKLVQRRTADAVKAVLASGKPKFTGFLNDREAALAAAELNRHQGCAARFFGGYEGAERSMLCVFEGLGDEPGDTDFPLAAVRITVKGGPLTHRDYLGSLLGTGLERSCIGDILPDDTGALVYVQAKVAPFLLDEVKSIGRYDASVCMAEADAPAESLTAAGQSHSASVASLRLDAVLSAMLHLGRSEAAALVARGLVQVNHLLVENGHYRVAEEDTLSIRGRGKYRITAIGGKSRKNRVFIEYLQY